MITQTQTQTQTQTPAPVAPDAAGRVIMAVIAVIAIIATVAVIMHGQKATRVAHCVAYGDDVAARVADPMCRVALTGPTAF